VRFLFDENLSPRLVQRLGDLFPSALHVRDAGLKQSSDEDIWNYAKQPGCCTITTDSDFRTRALALGPPPQVVLIERCDFPTQIIEALIRRQTIRIGGFIDSGEALLVVRRKQI
jgi:predicted nuclease of predicted toxin-antitoxin system